MKIPEVYHSAHKEENENLSFLNYYKNNSSYVFTHDLNNGSHCLFEKADCVYSEPAWRSGYKLFKERANIKNAPDFKSYMNSIENIILDLGKPSFIVGGKHMLSYIKPQTHIKILFNGFEALLMIWNTETIDVKNNIELLEIISKKYNTCLDFSCGYGNHLQRFKNFIGSDINGKCVYYIAKNYMGYNE